MTIKDLKEAGAICLIAWFCVFHGAAGTVHAASFDCKKAKAPIEKAICTDKDISALDEQLASKYKALLKTLDEAGKTVVKMEQKYWLKNTRGSAMAEPRIFFSQYFCSIFTTAFPASSRVLSNALYFDASCSSSVEMSLSPQIAISIGALAFLQSKLAACAAPWAPWKTQKPATRQSAPIRFILLIIIETSLEKHCYLIGQPNIPAKAKTTTKNVIIDHW